MQNGDQQGAQASMDDIESQLSELKQQLAEAKMLEDALDEMAQCKDGMCQGGAGNKQGKKPGKGMGRGRGEGERPEEKTKTGHYDTKVKQKIGKGGAVVTDLVDGPNVKGQVRQQIQAEFDEVQAKSADPLADQQLPRRYRDHAKEYFDSLREGK